MKRASIESIKLSRVFGDTQFARKYAKHMAKQGKKTGKQYASLLTKNGFDKSQILDAGCGAGDVAIELACIFTEAKLIGVDLSEPLLEIAESSTKEAGLSNRISWEKANVEALPFADNSFDVVVSVNMLHHVENPVAMLNEIERVLPPHGVFILDDIKRSWIGWFDRSFRSAFTWAEAKMILKSSKLRPWKGREGFLGFRVWAEGV